MIEIGLKKCVINNLEQEKGQGSHVNDVFSSCVYVCNLYVPMRMWACMCCVCVCVCVCVYMYLYIQKFVGMCRYV